MTFMWIIAWIVGWFVLSELIGRWTEKRFGITGIAWGGSDTDHPGWWWICNGVYVRPLRTPHQHGAGNGEKHDG